MHPYPVNFLTIFQSFWVNRFLILQMTRREIIGRYQGSVIGLLWSFFTPLLMLGVYTFVFTVIFQSRWASAGSGKTEFATILFAGLIVYTFFAECINRAPGLILRNVNYVKKVVFPLEILCWISLGSALFQAAASTSVLLLFYAVTSLSLHWTLIFLPLLFLPLMLLIMGLSWFLASLGVFVRDVTHSITLITTVMLFLSPVFYPTASIPEPYRELMLLNPLTFIIEQVRDVLIWGKLPNWTGLGIYFLCSLLFAWLGMAWFQKTRKGFADII